MGKKVYITIFFIICLIPSLFMLIKGPSTAGANELLSPSPKMGINVLSETGDYMSDHFAFRKELISCYSWICSNVFKTSTDDQIILGKDGYLYYSDTAPDYEGVRLSDEELAKIAFNLKSMQQQIEERGGTFIFTIAPNKSSLHGEHMPDKYTPGHENSNAVILESYLNEYGVNYVNLFDGAIPYYKTDSHWTAQGAAIACDALLGTSYASGEFICSDGIMCGDLYEMLYPAFKGAEYEVRHNGTLNFESARDTNGGKAITIETTGRGEKSLFCYRDSFGISLYPFLADASSDATFSRSNNFDMSATGDADIVILEIVERNLYRLI